MRDLNRGYISPTMPLLLQNYIVLLIYNLSHAVDPPNKFYWISSAY